MYLVISDNSPISFLGMNSVRTGINIIPEIFDNAVTEEYRIKSPILF